MLWANIFIVSILHTHPNQYNAVVAMEYMLHSMEVVVTSQEG